MMSTTQVPTNEVRELCVAAFMNAGLSTEEATIVATDYIEAETAGRTSHGLAGIDIALADAKRRGHADVQIDTSTLTVISGNGDMGHIVLAQHLPHLAEKASDSGIAALSMSDVSRVASPGTIARALAHRQLASISIEYGGQAFIAAPGKQEPSLSTNPISIGFPRIDAPPLILDMATSARAFFFVRLAQQLGETIPSTWAFDRDGGAVEDPAQVHSLAPFGGYKGFALSFMFEVLTGPMLGVPVGRKGSLARRGLLVIALKPDAFGRSLIDIDADVADLIADLDGAKYPGKESGERLYEATLSGMLSVEAAALERLRDMARR